MMNMPSRITAVGAHGRLVRTTGMSLYLYLVVVLIADLFGRPFLSASARGRLEVGPKKLLISWGSTSCFTIHAI